MTHINSIKKYISLGLVLSLVLCLVIFSFVKTQTATAATIRSVRTVSTAKIAPPVTQRSVRTVRSVPVIIPTQTIPPVKTTPPQAPPVPTQTQINRSIYIWSSAFSNYTMSYIEQYLATNNISTAIVSSSNKPAFNQLLTDLHQRGTKVELMIGNNNFLTNPNPVAYLDNILNGIDTTKLSAVHLDVEPYATSSFPDYHSREQYYQNLYINLLQITKTYLNQRGIPLTVSIPVFYPESTLNEIYRQADTVYVMAYQITSMNYLKTRLQEEIALGKEKTIPAFRANDFTTRAAFETYLTNAMTTLGTSKVVLHDIGRFMVLDAGQ